MTSPNLEAEVTQLHAEICAGLADPNRILILYALSQGPRNVTELCNELNVPQPSASRHLKVLRERGMVTTERRGTVIIYSLGDTRLVEGARPAPRGHAGHLDPAGHAGRSDHRIFSHQEKIHENFPDPGRRNRRHDGGQ